IQGVAGNDTLLGGDGNDFVSGGKNNDDVSGEDGADSVSGGTGFDTFHTGDAIPELLDKLSEDLVAAPLEGRYHIRVNQAGYLPTDRKTALVLTYYSLAAKKFTIIDSAGTTVFSAYVGKDRGAYGAYPHLYEMDFSGVQVSGRFRVVVE